MSTGRPNGWSSSSGSAKTPPSCPARAPARSDPAHENTSTRRPSTSATCSTSRCANPAPGALSGAAAVQVTRSRETACPTTPRSSGSASGPDAAARDRAVTSMRQPSPAGSRSTQGSRHASSRHVPSASVSYQRGSADSADTLAFTHRCRSVEVACRTVSTFTPASSRGNTEPVYDIRQSPDGSRVTLPVHVADASGDPAGPCSSTMPWSVHVTRSVEVAWPTAAFRCRRSGSPSAVGACR